MEPDTTVAEGQIVIGSHFSEVIRAKTIRWNGAAARLIGLPAPALPVPAGCIGLRIKLLAASNALLMRKRLVGYGSHGGESR